MKKTDKIRSWNVFMISVLLCLMDYLLEELGFKLPVFKDIAVILTEVVSVICSFLEPVLFNMFTERH